jgi:membrane-associated protease RseP (regulator of RpoE activity)
VSLDQNPQTLDPDGSPVGVFLPPPAPKARLWLHILLFLLTIGSSTFCGGLYYGWLPSPDLLDRIRDPRLLVEGLKFSLPLMTILLAHEMGHYVAARRHRLRVTLPYFLPMPIPLLFSPGTLGAIIRVKEPIRSRRQLLDVGAWGPIAGFVTLLPFLVAGIALSGVQQLDPEGTGVYFGEPILFKVLARSVFFPNLAPGEDIMVHPTAWAAWFGLFVTSLNMLPFFQLDGGHVCYALFGGRHRAVAWPLLGVLAALGLLWPGWWLWAIILAVLGPRHPPVLDEDRPLNRRRRWIGWLALLIFALSFSPRPIWISPS